MNSIAMHKRPLDGSPHCGDACSVWHKENKIYLCMVDGLGHGAEAEEAAMAALAFVGANLGVRPKRLFAECDESLRVTRGVAMGLAVVDLAKNEVSFAGIGNTRALMSGLKQFRFSSDYGIVGAGYRRLVVETVPIFAGDLLVLSTDGVSERMVIPPWTGSAGASLKELAVQTLDEWSDGADDAAVLIYRHVAGGTP